MHFPFSHFTGAVFLRMNCQVVGTDNNCLRVQTRGEGGGASQGRRQE